MGLLLWSVSSVAAFALARFAPWLRRKQWVLELSVALAAALALGVLATALDFGGWNEPDWRAGLFTGCGALAAIALTRLIGSSRQNG